MSLQRLEYNPFIAAIAGYPLAGKTTLGTKLSRLTNLVHLDIDQQTPTTGEVLGNPPRNWFENSMQMGIRYSQLHRIAAGELISGNPVLLTATYSHETYEYSLRMVLADTYRRWKKLDVVPLLIFELEAPVERLAERLAARDINGSLSSVTTLEHARLLREKFVHLSGDDVIRVDTGLPLEENVAQVLEILSPFRRIAA